MKKLNPIIAVLLLVVSTAIAADNAAPARIVTAGQPIWAAGSVSNEPLLFVQEEGQPVATARLFYTPSGGLKITGPYLLTTFVEGKDYVRKAGSDVVELTAASAIPFKTHAQMFPPKGSPNSWNGILFADGHVFHDLQVQASYTTAGKWAGAVPPEATDKLKTVLGKLKAKQPVKIVTMGDSITEGYNASGFAMTNVPPHQPAYPQLVANTLQERFGSKVSVVNLGKGGTKAPWGMSQVEKVKAEKPDLVILAFGMNHKEPADKFGAAMRALVDALKAGSPDADIVLVASMCGNPGLFPSERFEAYRDVQRKMEGPGVALADVTSVWLELMKKKRFADFSGNNANHPNDFGYRLYAQVILQLIGK